ncbi:MAG: hypothetical protein ACRDON_09320 [Gaiellaceae bacterium]
MRRWITWVVAGAVAALVVAGVVDTILRSEGDSPRPSAANPDEPRPGPTPTTGAVVPAPLPACRREQLALAIEVLGGGDVYVLRHVRGGPCRLRAARVTLTIRDRRGRRIQPASTVPEISGEFPPGTEFVGLLNYLITCREEEPIRATVKVGRYRAHRTFPLPSYCPR